MSIRSVLALVLVVSMGSACLGANKKKPAKTWPWRAWIESESPFFSAVIDARDFGIADNVTPRALVFPVADECYVAFDVDLLRVSVVWTPEELPLINAGMAVNAYPYVFQKVGGGQKALPKPNGEVWIQNGIYPGVSVGKPSFVDPRPVQPTEGEVGRGGLRRELGRFVNANALTGAIAYEVGGGVAVSEQFQVDQGGLIRRFTVGPCDQSFYVVIAESGQADGFEVDGGVIEVIDGHVVCRISPSKRDRKVSIRIKRDVAGASPVADRDRRWKGTVRLPLPKVDPAKSLSFERIPLPLKNPWNRGVRAAAIDFFEDGRAALVTFDGDIWLTNALTPSTKQIEWTRWTSGLHEPIGLRIRNGEVFVFDRNGLWRISDTDGDGEAERHELYCSQIDQTSETREFAASLEVAKDGSFLVCKPGQHSSTTGRSSSAVLRISADGKHVTRIAHGFRQPALGYDPVTGHIAASDQQGTYVPSTPVVFVRQGGFYGFINQPGDKELPVTPPLTWIPHQVCGSASGIIWTRRSQLGALADVPLVLSFHPPKVLQVHTDVDEIVTQGGVTPLDVDIDGPLLRAAMNPADGLVYMTGFKVWGSVTNVPTILGRLRVNTEKTWAMPLSARTEKRGVLLTFATPLDSSAATKTSAYSIQRWNYRRTSKYGSPHFKLDGTKGTEGLRVASVRLSDDRKSVFLGVPDMRSVMQLAVKYDIIADDGSKIQNSTYLTAHFLRSFDLTKHGFADNSVDLSVNGSVPVVVRPIEPTLEKGQLLYTQLGCVACHSIDGSREGRTGPSWLGLFGSDRKLVETGKVVIADEDYIRESILNPTAKIAEGAVNGEAGMPIYEGVLNKEQLDSIVMYIRSLEMPSKQ